MKINELTLMNYATSADAPADKEGWLWKRGDVNKAFQKRYFVLKGNLVNTPVFELTFTITVPVAEIWVFLVFQSTRNN